MKKTLLLFAFSVSSAVVLAQFSLGVKAGYNASRLSASYDSVKTQFSNGFHLGAFARIGKRLYFQPELYYAFQGSVFESTLDKTDSSYFKQKLTIGTMDVPLLLGFRIINNKKVNLRLMAGAVASFTVNKKLTDEGGYTDPIEKTDLNSVNWAIQAGAGADLWLLTLDIRYQAGLSNLIDDVQNWTFNSKNNVWVVSLGFKIL